MSEQSFEVRGRTLLAGKIVYDFGQSSIDCVVRRISDRGATVTTESPLGIPEHFPRCCVRPMRHQAKGAGRNRVVT